MCGTDGGDWTQQNEPGIEPPSGVAIRAESAYRKRKNKRGEAPYSGLKYLSNRKNISFEDNAPEAPTQVWMTRCNAGAVRRAARRVTHFYDTVLAPTGLKLCQYGILSSLNARGAALPSVQDLAGELVLDRSTLGQNLRPLERDGLISLLTDPKDGRVRLIALTKEGLVKFREANRYWKTAQGRFESVFGKDEAAKLRTVLLSVAYNSELDRSRRGGPPRRLEK